VPLDELAEPWRSPRLRDIPLRKAPGSHSGSVAVAYLPPKLADVQWLARLGGLVERIQAPVLEAREREDRPFRRWITRDGWPELVTTEPDYLTGATDAS